MRATGKISGTGSSHEVPRASSFTTRNRTRFHETRLDFLEESRFLTRIHRKERASDRAIPSLYSGENMREERRNPQITRMRHRNLADTASIYCNNIAAILQQCTRTHACTHMQTTCAYTYHTIRLRDMSSCCNLVQPCAAMIGARSCRGSSFRSKLPSHINRVDGIGTLFGDRVNIYTGETGREYRNGMEIMRYAMDTLSHSVGPSPRDRRNP